MVTYKGITGLAPSYLWNLFRKNSYRKFDISLRNVDTDLYIPRMTTCKGQEEISFRGAKTWNQIPLDIKQANSLNSFKNTVKYHLQPSA